MAPSSDYLFVQAAATQRFVPISLNRRSSVYGSSSGPAPSLFDYTGPYLPSHTVALSEQAFVSLIDERIQVAQMARAAPPSSDFVPHMVPNDM